MINRSPEYQEQVPRFRETEPVIIWSAKLALHLPYDEFEQTISRTVMHYGHQYTGFVTRDADGNVTTFTQTRYPRKKYGLASVSECQEGIATLSRELDGQAESDTERCGFRVVLGLIEGYDDTAPTHSIDEVRHTLPQASVTPADIFAIRRTDAGVSIYTEPVAVIESSIDKIDDVYAIGDRFRQERFTIENFEQGIAYVVETRYCTDPD